MGLGMCWHVRFWLVEGVKADAVPLSVLPGFPFLSVDAVGCVEVGETPGCADDQVVLYFPLFSRTV